MGGKACGVIYVRCRRGNGERGVGEGRVVSRHHKSWERLRVEHVRFEGGPISLKLIPPLLRRFHEK